jgi:glycosyltransferase involved in cell wall biosynthesis
MGPRSVTVVVPVYNAADFVRDAVESAIAQPEVGEVVLVEDGSRDRSLEVCEALSREFEMVSLLQHSGGGNRGPAAARNLGVQAAGYPFVAFLDADDYYLPGRFRRATEVFACGNDIDGVYEAVGTHFEDSAGRGRWLTEGRNMLTTVRARVPPEGLIEALRIGDVGRFCTDGIVVRRSLFRKTGLFDEDLAISQDTVMWLKMAAVGKLVAGRIDEPVAMRRVHAGNRATKASMVEASRGASAAFYAWVDENGLDDRTRALALDYRLESEWRRINLRALGHAGRVRAKALAAFVLLSRSPWGLGARVAWLRTRRLCRVRRRKPGETAADRRSGGA